MSRGLTYTSIEVVFALANGGTGDGVTIAIQNDTRGVGALGLGGGLGYENITPSLAIELDTFMNAGEPAAPHIGIDRDGVIDTANATLTAWLDYDGVQDTVRGFVAIGVRPSKPAAPVIIAPDDLSRLGATAWIGVTSATGASAATNRMLALRVDVTP